MLDFINFVNNIFSKYGNTIILVGGLIKFIYGKTFGARPKWLLKGFPFVIVENSDKHYFKKVYLYIIAESDDGTLRANSTKDIQFPGKYSDTEAAYYIYPKDNATVNAIESKSEIALNFDGLKLKKGIKFRALILKAETDVEEVTYYLYDYHDKECFISKEDPNYRKYFDAIDNANLMYQSDDLEITTTTTTTTLSPGYDY
ncbi:hypothetical protein [Pediococcus pentosaceus]|uniref:hypothetical protein n=1 Tax=Pediococcus pentosaceus TaxID=1255 RepID=UPI00235F1C3F|nr:hypothetical protein [Pediococcus pentosaceus]MDD1388619.1 hypothetical protein [Pediococcus pentosaceus]